MELPALLERDGVSICSSVVPDGVVAGLVSRFSNSCGRPGTRGFELCGDIVELLGSIGSLGVLAA